MVVVGYGTKGRSAVSAVLAGGVEPSDIAVVDQDEVVLQAASTLGFGTVHGTGTRAGVLR